jgi:hypothetical protein
MSDNHRFCPACGAAQEAAAAQPPATAPQQPGVLQPGAPVVPAEFVALMEDGRPAATAYTEAELRSFKAADFAKMDEAQFGAVQRALAVLGRGGGQ